MEDAQTITGRVVTLLVVSILVLMVMVCGGLIIALYSMGERALDAREVAAERLDTIYTMRRSLDRAGAKLEIYEDFILGRQRKTVEKMVERYLTGEGLKAKDAKVAGFMDWMMTRYR